MTKSLLILIINLTSFTLLAQTTLNSPDNHKLFLPFELSTKQLKTPPSAEKQRLDSIISQQFSDGVWQLSQKREFTFNNDELLIAQNKFFRHDSLPEWEAFSRIEYTYDEDDNLIEILFLRMNDNGDWTNFERYTYSYTEGRVTQMIWATWFISLQEWRDNYELEYEYDAQDYLINTFQYKLYDQSGDLIARTAYDRDDEGRLLTYTIYLWNPVDEIWSPFDRDYYLYDDVQNLVTRTNERNIGNEWVNYSQGNFTYNNDYQYDDLIVDGTIEQYRHQRVYEEYSGWNQDLEEWNDIGGRSDYYYSSLLTNIENAALPQLRIFPNPTNGVINFDIKNPTFANIKLYDAQGKYMNTQSLQNNQISVKHLNSGVYFYELFHEGEIFGGKFIVK